MKRFMRDYPSIISWRDRKLFKRWRELIKRTYKIDSYSLGSIREKNPLPMGDKRELMRLGIKRDWGKK